MNCANTKHNFCNLNQYYYCRLSISHSHKLFFMHAKNLQTSSAINNDCNNICIRGFTTMRYINQIFYLLTYQVSHLQLGWKFNGTMTSPLVAKVLWTLCYASPEEIPKLQHPRCATGNRRNLQCGDDFIMRAKATRDTGSPCLGAVGTSVWRSALLVVSFSVLASILLCSLSMSGAALSTRLRGRYVSGDPVHDLASASK